MKKKIVLFSAVIVFAVATLVGCSISGLDVKVKEATTDKNTIGSTEDTR